MTAADTIVRRLTAMKYPNAGRYLFEPHELVQIVEAIQQDARGQAAPEDDVATFILRHIDDRLWDQFRAKAAAEGVTTKQLLLRIIEAYLNGK
jgi:hypothetical protein